MPLNSGNPLVKPAILALVCASFLAASATGASAQRGARALDTVVVVASRTGMPAATTASRSVEIITRADIDASPARTVADLLASAMSVDVYTRSPAQSDVSIRGSTADQVVLLVNGVRVSDVQSSHYAMDLTVPLASIDHIEILRGAASALYGADAVGGVINIVTRTAPASVNAHGGSFGSVGGALASGVEEGGRASSIAADFDKSDGHRDGTDFRMGQARAALTVPLAGGSLRNDLALGVRDFGAADFYAPYNSIERTTSTTASSRWEGSAAGWFTAANAATRRHQDHYVLIRGNPAVYENRHESWETSGALTARHAIGSAMFAAGAEAEHDQLSSARLGGRREWRTGEFAELTGGTAAMRANAGLRADHSSAYGDFLSPSVSASIAAASGLHFHGSAGLGFRAPTWTERYYTDPSNIGDPNLRPEHFSNGELGARVEADALSADLTLFARHATNLIDWVVPRSSAAPGPWRATNVGDATFRGAELSIDARPVSGFRPSLFASGLSLTASEGDAVSGKYALRPITRQIGARLATPVSSPLTARVEIVNARRAREHDYTTGNVRLAWRHSAYRLTLDALNLANAQWLDASGKPAAPRGLYAGVDWTR